VFFFFDILGDHYGPHDTAGRANENRASVLTEYGESAS